MRYIHRASGLLVDLVVEDVTTTEEVDGDYEPREVLVGKILRTETGQHAYWKIPGDDMIAIVVNVFGASVEVQKYE